MNQNNSTQSKSLKNKTSLKKGQASSGSSVTFSVVVPIYNEEANLLPLFQRLVAVFESAVQESYELIFVNDGSQDSSLALLRDFFQKRPDVVRIVDFHGNFGQHMAIMAGFEKSRGRTVITLDADLQNPPEEIPKLLEAVAQGSDYVGSYRANRQDSFFRTGISKVINWIRKWITNIHMTDQGCMLRAYDRTVIDQIVASQERATFIPALAYQFAANPQEVEVRHEARGAGESKYNLYRLVRLNFDLVTGFSLVPLQVFTLFGMTISGLSGLLVAYMLGRRLILGPEAQGVFTLLAILIFLVSVAITGIGIVGEYVGRIFQTLSRRPRYIIREMIER